MISPSKNTARAAGIALLTLGAALLCGQHNLSADSRISKEEQAAMAELKSDLDKILAVKRMKDVKASIHVRDLDTGQTVYEKDPDRQLNPASNAKIITAAAVLDRFGPSHTFKTEIWSDRKDREGTVEGDIVLTGNGDPFLKWNHLLELAERTRRKGVKTVAGDLVVDDTAFDDRFMPPAFDQKNEEAPYRTTVGAVSAEFSAMTVIVAPRKAGQKPSVRFEPPGDYAIVENSAVSVDSAKEAKSKPLAIRLAKGRGRTRVIITGNTHKGATVRKRVDFPTIYAGHLMKEAFRVVGIKVKGAVRRGKRPEGHRLMARHHSYTMTYNILAMQKWSNNFMAEMLYKSLDLNKNGPATWSGAQSRVEKFLGKAGLKPGSYKFTNGSGLYDANRLSARQFTTLLAYMHTRRDILPDFETSFAIAGVDGTLGRRMKDTGAHRVLRGKTGTLNRVVTLTGTVQTKSGRKLGFSILFNNAKGGAWGFRQIQDKIGARLARYGTNRAQN